MTKHFFRNLISLTLLYCIIILGIFAVQFRNQSVLRKTIGPLRYNAFYEQNNAQETILKNNFRIVYKGFDIFFNDTVPIALISASKEKQSLKLEALTETDSSVTLSFTGGVTLTFRGSSQPESLFITADMPDGASGLIIPYKTPKNSAKELGETRLLLTTEENKYILTGGSSISDSVFTLSPEFSVAQYKEYSPEQTFSLTSIEKLPMAQEAAYKSTLTRFRTGALTVFKQNMNATVTEKTVVAYMAEMAAQNKYAAGFDSVPAAFKNGDTRTYLSAPYFNTLVKMNKTLMEADQKTLAAVSADIQNKNPGVFLRQDGVSFLFDRGQNALLSRMLEIPGTIANFAPNAETSAGILQAYADVKKLNPATAEILKPVLSLCEQALIQSMVLRGGRLYIPAKDETIDTVSSVQIARALIAYGSAADKTIWSQAGYLLINSLFAAEADMQSTGNSLQEEYMLAEGINGAHSLNPAVLYPLLITDNTFYPHEVRIIQTGTVGVPLLRAWTIAQSVSVQKDSAGNMTLSVRFPQGDTHYMIINGVEPFLKIQLYGIDYRTDPRFESYNSSGYIYERDTKTLLLKMRHKSAVEDVHLIYAE